MGGQDAVETERPKIDTTVAHPARRYNYWLGGKDHFQADRDSGDAIAAAFPTVRMAALANRNFMRRAVAFLAAEAGIRQFLDIGTGIPAPNNTHEVAQAIAPESRVVYVDNDPIVLSHARALLTSSSTGATAYIEADVRNYKEILRHPDLLRTIDLDQSVALLLIAIVHFIDEPDDVYAIVDGILSALPSGSYLALSNATADFAPPEVKAAAMAELGKKPSALRPRSHAEMTGFVTGLELVPPGIVSSADWRADDEPTPRLAPAEASTYVLVARKP